MPNTPEGTFAISASGIAGCSVLVLNIKGGQVRGNDSAGARLSGIIYEHDAKHLKLSIDVALRLDTFCVWGTSTAETGQSRQFNQVIPKSVFDGQPHTMTVYELTIAATRVADEYQYAADVGGLETLMIATLQRRSQSLRSLRPKKPRQRIHQARRASGRGTGR